jgi:hypothetical protein
MATFSPVRTCVPNLTFPNVPYPIVLPLKMLKLITYQQDSYQYAFIPVINQHVLMGSDAHCRLFRISFKK